MRFAARWRRVVTFGTRANKSAHAIGRVLSSRLVWSPSHSEKHGKGLAALWRQSGSGHKEEQWQRD
jgi:hypothetical protein